ncbi:PEP-CTERM sorting domain-containing protein [Luteolibacter sp. Populi]|uniref:PEP-CTERM sorting domain-containing protein n=1 Tax=Luteolibacter sp. Populi TaxID=3230487 RepID=UPI003465E2E7
MKKVTLRFRFIFASAIGALGIGCCDGAITLTIDTIHQTFTWTGSATSDTLELTTESYSPFRLGATDRVGGYGVGGGDSISVVEEVGDRFSSQSPGAVVMVPADGTIHTDLGWIRSPRIGQQVRLAITGNGIAYSYASEVPWIGSPAPLDGVQLYFQYQAGADIINLGSAAGQVVVIPEPSSGMLLLGAGAGLALRRRRR